MKAEDVLHKPLDAEGAMLVRGLRNTRDELKALVALEADLKDRFKAWMGLASVALGEDGVPVATVSLVFKETFDVRKAAADPVYAAMVKACTTASSYSTVRLV